MAILPNPEVVALFERRTSSIQYLVICPETRSCAIVDPVLDFDPKCGSIATHSADKILEEIARRQLKLQWILDTHPHADHLSAAAYLKDKTGAPTAIGSRVTAVQNLWKVIYNLPGLATDGSQWDRLFDDGDRFQIGNLQARVMAAPGHTLASITYVIGDAAFIHDTLFMPDAGTARADFPGADPGMLWDTIQGILALPETTRLFVGHDYQPGGREPRWHCTVAEQKAGNVHLRRAPTKEEFVALRTERDRTLPMPALILFALQVNINGGRLPEPETNGQRYLKYPINRFTSAAWE